MHSRMQLELIFEDEEIFKLKNWAVNSLRIGHISDYDKNLVEKIVQAIDRLTKYEELSP